MVSASSAAGAAGEISSGIGGVAQAADSTLQRAKESQKAAQEMAAIATQLTALVRQFKIERSERRMDKAIPLKLRAVDVNGRIIEQEVESINVSPRGAHLKGIRGNLRAEGQLSLSRGGKTEKFAITWVRPDKNSDTCEVGVSALDPTSSLWDDAGETYPQPELTGSLRA